MSKLLLRLLPLVDISCVLFRLRIFHNLILKILSHQFLELSFSLDPLILQINVLVFVVAFNVLYDVHLAYLFVWTQKRVDIVILLDFEKFFLV